MVQRKRRKGAQKLLKQQEKNLEIRMEAQIAMEAGLRYGIKRILDQN